MGVACLNFVEKTFVDGCKIVKFVKVFSLESFLLYGTCNYLLQGHTCHLSLCYCRCSKGHFDSLSLQCSLLCEHVLTL